MTIRQEAKLLFGHLIGVFRSGDEKLTEGSIDALPVIHLESGAFEEGGEIPQRFSQEGENVSPELRWRNLPAGTKELALFCEDPDAPMAKPYLHWMAYGIAATVTGLPEGVPTDVNVGFGVLRQGRNDGMTIGYTGPMPPVGHGVHHYHFQLFALNRKLSLRENPIIEELAKAMKGHVIGQGELVGTYERK